MFDILSFVTDEITAVEPRVRYAETDQMGVAYHTHYLVWCEVARTDHMRQRGVTYRELEGQGLRLAGVEAGVRYREPAPYHHLLSVPRRGRGGARPDLSHRAGCGPPAELDSRPGQEPASRGAGSGSIVKAAVRVYYALAVALVPGLGACVPGLESIAPSGLEPAPRDTIEAWLASYRPAGPVRYDVRWRFANQKGSTAGRAAVRIAPPDTLRFDYRGPVGRAGAAVIVADSALWGAPG